ncbi:MAG: deoxyribose-phosphate aldolase [Roseiarcus sp.]
MDQNSAEVARRAISLIDLTSLNDDDTDDRIAKLCGAATTPFGPVAAVCVYRRFVRTAKKRLDGSGVRVAAVANFPSGTASVSDTSDEVRELVATGADEVDVVLPYQQMLAGDERPAVDLLAAVREICGPTVTLKAILETGAYGEDRAKLTAAAELAIRGGANFVKTSTGKISVGATPFAASCILETIRRVGAKVGFKASGGIRSVAQAVEYLELADRIMGADWATPATFRFGVSRLLDDLVAELEAPPRSA